MKKTDHTDKNITWMAHTIQKVNNDCIDSGKYPNGRKLTDKERVEMIIENIECQIILAEHGVTDNQLTLF